MKINLMYSKLSGTLTAFELNIPTGLSILLRVLDDLIVKSLNRASVINAQDSDGNTTSAAARTRIV